MWAKMVKQYNGQPLVEKDFLFFVDVISNGTSEILQTSNRK
jgi:hypothetical protein